MHETSTEFFVGYLPVPARQRRFLIFISGAILCAIGVTAVLVAARQRDPGPAQWLDDRATEFVGLVLEHPYPMLRTINPDGSVRTLLIVSEGKLGAAGALVGWDHRAAKLRGTILMREGTTLLELSEGPKVPESSALAKPQAASGSPAASRAVALRGEIIDPKCFAGAMKPGDGKPHKSCAALCLRGGIPPMFTRRNEAGQSEFYLITNEAGERAVGALLDALVARVGHQTELRGTIQQLDDVTLLRVDASQFQGRP